MKITSLLQKSALAAAIATVSFGAAALELEASKITGAAKVIAEEALAKGVYNVPVTLADALEIQNAKINPSPSLTNTITIRLSGGALFAAASEQGEAGADDNNNPVSIRRVSGGKDANYVTYELEGTSGVTFDGPIDLVDLSVKNITGPVKVTVELNNSYEPDVSKAEDVVTVEKAASATITPTGYSATLDDRQRIQVTADETKFTEKVGVAAATDFDGAPKDVINLATIQLYHDDDALAFDGDLASGKTATVTYTLSADGVDLKNYGKVFVTTDTVASGECSDTSSTNDAAAKLEYDEATQAFVGTTASPATLVGLTTATATPLQLCATVADNEEGAKIPEADLSLGVVFNYEDTANLADTKAGAALGEVLRNGCQVTLFNLPKPSGADTDRGYIRFTNTSSRDGEVRATVIGENGERLDTNVTVISELKAGATSVLHSDTGNINNKAGFLGDLLPEYAADTNKGRYRIELTGAFSSCEALGLIRDKTGPLNNMSATAASK